jgi:putative flippase GtrA
MFSIILATSSAIVFSFILNRSYVFRDTSNPRKKFILFSLVAASGTLIVQTSVFIVVTILLDRTNLSKVVIVNASNLVASFIVMFWNYQGFLRLVFKSSPQHESHDA